MAAAMAAAAPQGGITIFGRVYAPDGQTAVRVRVRVDIVNGMTRETVCDDQGNYEFRGMPAGRYRLSATNPEAPEEFAEPAESDSTRSYANRLQINVYMRLPIKHGVAAAPPGVVSVEEASQNIPKAARKAYEQGMKLQKEKRDPEKALAQFNQAIEIYPAYFQALTERANLRMERNQLAEAGADFEQALKSNAKYVPALRGLGYCQIQRKEFPAAVANLERAFALAPNVPLTLLLLGYGNLSLNRYEAAKQCLLEALRLDKVSAARAHIYLGEVYAKEQKFTEAADEVLLFLKSTPQAPDAAQLKELERQWRARGKAPNNK
ncbi:MAG: tetratricopeptide repeat protein [Blastocatellia bacterium]|nr:tetratricopeptide repeat protein [Blastocatellia bacterium]